MIADAKTAEPLRSWDETALDSAPIGWPQRDVHGFLCYYCGDAEWQLIPVGNTERLCARCARKKLSLEPGQVLAPRLPRPTAPPAATG